MKTKIIYPIIIDNSDLPNAKTLRISYHNNNLEGFLRDIFIEIIKKNTINGGVIKLVDLKNKYIELIQPALVSANVDATQIFKNLTSSNKDNTTHLIRSENIGWYYINSSKIYADEIEYSESSRKPIPLPKELERSRTKKYFVYYIPELNDSPISVIESMLENTKDISIDQVLNTQYDDIDFSQIPEDKVDYLERQRISTEIGEVGEKYIFEKEIQYCIDKNISESPIWVSKKTDKVGFDILSYRISPDGTALRKIYIEVKTTNGGLRSKFYVSSNEIRKSREIENYVICRVYNASDELTIDHRYYNGSFEDNFHRIEVDHTMIYRVR